MAQARKPEETRIVERSLLAVMAVVTPHLVVNIYEGAKDPRARAVRQDRAPRLRLARIGGALSDRGAPGHHRRGPLDGSRERLEMDEQRSTFYEVWFIAKLARWI